MIIIRAMDPYELLWMVLLIVFVLGELATIGLTCIWFAAGALAALVMAMAGVNPVVQFLVFLVVSILLLVATRPWARKYVNAKMQRTNADSLIGENIRISERVSNMDQTGLIIPAFTNAHTHVADYIVPVDLSLSLEDLVAPPNGFKYQMLNNTPESVLRCGIEKVSEYMFKRGVTSFIDFREGSISGAKILSHLTWAQPVIMGKPVTFDAEELSVRRSNKIF